LDLEISEGDLLMVALSTHKLERSYTTFAESAILADHRVPNDCDLVVSITHYNISKLYQRRILHNRLFSRATRA
jgi:hypothetical protein